MDLTRLAQDIDHALAELRTQRDLSPGLLVAVSGGPDSLALLLAIASLAHRLPIFAATVDHGLRAEAGEEARLVAGLAADLGIPHATLSWRHEGITGNLQGAAREARYRLLAAHARRVGAGAVLTAHHRRDQIETHLLLRERGARGSALAGMRLWRDLEPRVALVRPLLRRAPEQLAEVVRRAGWRAVDDPSNRDVRFARVRLRQTLGTYEENEATDALRCADARRIAEDGDMAASLRLLAEEGRLTLSADGAAGLQAPVPWRSEGLPPRLLARIVTAAGGSAVPPPTLRVESLRHRLQQDLDATLGGCHVRARRDTIVFAREFGREGPPAATAGEDGTAWFDRRFNVAGLQTGERVEAIGGRGGAATRPALRGDDGSLRPVPLRDGALAVWEGPIHAVSTVGWRLWADLPGAPPDALTARPQIAAKTGLAVGKV